jgi:hypothetical protein
MRTTGLLGLRPGVSRYALVNYAYRPRVIAVVGQVVLGVALLAVAYVLRPHFPKTSVAVVAVAVFVRAVLSYLWSRAGTDHQDRCSRPGDRHATAAMSIFVR